VDNNMYEEDDEFSLVQPFYVDNGELDGLSLKHAFVLGYEFCCIMEKLYRKEFPFEVQFHSDNETRVRKALDSHHANYEIHVHDDWPVLVVSGVSSI